MDINYKGRLTKRILIEIESLSRYPIPNTSIIMVDNNPWYYIVKIKGLDGSPFENGIFIIELYLPEIYPIMPPKARFQTRIYHPNIDKIGRINLELLHSNWAPSLSMRNVILGIQDLLSNPNPDRPFDSDIGSHWKQNKIEAISTAKE